MQSWPTEMHGKAKDDVLQGNNLPALLLCDVTCSKYKHILSKFLMKVTPSKLLIQS